MIAPNDSLATYTERSRPSPKLVGSGIELFQERLLGLFDVFYDKIDGVLLDAADKTESNGVRASYVLATQQFRNHRQASRNAFSHEMQQATAWLCTSNPPSGEPVPGRAWYSTSTEPVELEERLAVENLISKSSSRYRDTLLALDGQLSGLVGVPFNLAANPIDPAVICAALRAAIEPIAEIQTPIRLVVYKLFDKQVMDRLGGLYNLCIKVSSKNGECSTRRPIARGTPDSSADALRFKSPPRLAHPPPFAILRRVLAQGRPPRQTAGDRILATDELMRLLSDIQHLASPTAAPTTTLRTRLSSMLGRSLAKADETTLDLVFLLFEHLLADKMLPDGVEVLIARLQIPILKVALLDESFFDNPEHPARNLVNHMAQAAMGWTDDGDRSPEGLYGHLERLVDQAIDDFDQDLTLFARLDAQLRAALADEDKSARAREHRARQLAEDRAQASSTAQVVTLTLGAYVRRYRNVPSAIVELIERGWGEVLATSYSLDSPQSRNWRDKVALIDRLLWSICPKTEQGERRELLRSIPTLMRQLRLGLNDTALDPRQVAGWLRELQVLHLNALRGEGTAEPIPEMAPGLSADLAHPDLAEEVVAPYAVEPVELTPGTWIALHRDDTETVRLKLIWRSEDGTRQLFIDRQGRHTVELDSGWLATRLAEGTVEIVGHEDEAIVDRAIAALLQSVQH